MRSKLIVALFMFCSLGASAMQNNWHEVKDKKGVKVYNQSIEGSSFKAFRAEMTVDANLTTLIAAFNDVEAGTSWVENVDEMRLVKTTTVADTVTYTLSKAPWPVSDRDAVVHNITTQDPETLVVTIDQAAVPDFVPRVKGNVRIEQLNSTWTFTPVSETETYVTYQVFTEPGGKLPAWLVNTVAVSQPYKTFLGLRDMAAKSEYQTQAVEHIQNY
ncbi:START domain-containing protein [Vibrio agarivorans]|uniref:START domain-containing protein n=1 Tax=Vibrio agarivorans TaxID=153622 RepID=UPI0022326BDE|nr:START domain-containing protein [Vibrio agarivorans]MDN3663173.1 START domain-containing protein [Vibrio agarivorans]